MNAISLHPYTAGTAVFIGFPVGVLIGAVMGNLAFGLCLSVGLGAVIDGIMRIRACGYLSD